MSDMRDDGPWLSSEDQRLWGDWLRLNALLPAALNRTLRADAGLSVVDFDVLARLADSPQARLRVNDLARSLGWERSRVSHHLTRMERRGLAHRQECEVDGRGAWVVLTKEGRGAIDGAAPAHAAAVQRLLLADLSSHERDVMLAVVDRVLERLVGVSD